MLGHVNRLLARHGRRLGPDPASTDIACVGGVIANNSGGMRCGVVADSYRTVRSMTFVLANGAVIDTAAPDAEQRFAAAAPELAAGLLEIRDELRADTELAARINAQVRDQEHHRLPAVRVPRRRHTAGDLPAAGRRLGGDAGVRRRGGVRHRPARPPRDDRAGRLRGPRRAAEAVGPLVAAGATRDRADGRADADRRRLQHAGHARGVEGAPADSAALLVEFRGAGRADDSTHPSRRPPRSWPAGR